MLNGNAKLVEDAAVLCRRPGGLSQSERDVVVRAGLAILAAGGPRDYDQVRVVTCGERLYATTPREAPPKPPTPFDEKIAAAETEMADAQARYDAALAAFQEAADAVTRGPAADPEYDKSGNRKATFVLNDQRFLELQAARDLARESLRQADDHWLRVKARLIALEAARTRWRADNS
jgi:hypothetical protein